MDLVRPLGLAGIKSAVAVPPGAASRFSRFTVESLDWAHPWEEPEKLVERLVQFARQQREPPVLFFQSDGDLLLVSRNRKLLGKYFRFAIADPELVENLVDKSRFQVLAERLKLPVPPAQRLLSTAVPNDLKLRFPIVIKPLTRRPEIWKAVVKSGKALRINNAEEFRAFWPTLTETGVGVLAQELVPGPETRIESYHVYVDHDGRILGEFTGQKIRTYPLEYGDSTALVTTDASDVAMLGRELVQQLGLTGVAKFDFKRAPDGRLYLLEVNPRFNLWHHLGAVAGVNLPSLAYQDLIGDQEISLSSARAGLRWCRVWQDILAARESQLNTISWLRWATGCEAKRLLAWDDPMPMIGGVGWRLMNWLRKATTISGITGRGRAPLPDPETLKQAL